MYLGLFINGLTKKVKLQLQLHEPFELGWVMTMAKNITNEIKGAMDWVVTWASQDPRLASLRLYPTFVPRQPKIN